MPVVKREGAHTGYVYNPAVNGGAAMYPQTFDTLRMRLSSITGETRGYLYDYLYNTYFDTPISITAIARQGYHFLHWVDSHGVIVCEDATFVAPAGSSGVWAETTYYAIFTEDQDVMIKYQVSDPDHAWLSRDKESVAPSTGRALGTEVHLLPGYRVVGWAVDWDGGDMPSIDELIELGKIIFNPPRYGEGLAGAQIFYDPADPLKGGHTYTAIIEPAEDIEFIVNHHFQSNNGVTFELKKTDEYKGPQDARVDVRYEDVMQPDGSTLRKYHLYLIDDNGTATGILIDEILLGPDYTSADGLTWLYAPISRHRPRTAPSAWVASWFWISTTSSIRATWQPSVIR